MQCIDLRKFLLYFILLKEFIGPSKNIKIKNVINDKYLCNG